LLERLRVSTSGTVKELQDIIYDLRPSVLDDLGLIRAMRWYAEERLESRGLRVILDMPDETVRLPADVETALFRIGQEAITNIGRHARAHEVRICLEVDELQARMEISDDGVGFVPSTALAGEGSRRAWGLLGMQERAALLGGELSVASEPGCGTRMCVTLPLEGGST